MLNNALIYATDLNDASLKKAAEGFVPLSQMQAYSRNYINAGGMGSLSDYYTAMYENAVFKKELLKNVTWARHNLVSDRSFNAFDLILCRNVLIYFNPSLQERVHKLILDSLSMHGFMALGKKESIQFTRCEKHYCEVDSKEKIYRIVKHDT
jgi:chemotaxis protein methyltransferase CheR